MRQREFQKLLKRYRKGLCSPEEQAFVEKWFRAMGSSDGPFIPASERKEIKNRSWERVRDYVGQSRSGDNRSLPSGRWLDHPVRTWAIAAGISVLIVSGIFLITTPREGNRESTGLMVSERKVVNTTPGEKEFILEDGTRVVLKPESRLCFQEPFDRSQRLVTLEGEAFFDVSRDTLRPFLVNSGEVITKVLGTSFTITAFPDDDNITVSVQTGKVSVITKNGQHATAGQSDETILTPNQKIIYNKTMQLVSRSIVNEPVPVVPDEVIRRMHFEAAPISEIFQALEEVYGVDIDFDADVFASCILTTSIADGSIYNRLNMICKAIDAQYEIKEDHIEITGDGCIK